MSNYGIKPKYPDKGDAAINNRLKKVEVEVADLRKQLKEAALNNDDGAQVVKDLRAQVKQKENVMNTLREALNAKRKW